MRTGIVNRVLPHPPPTFCQIKTAAVSKHWWKSIKVGENCQSLSACGWRMQKILSVNVGHELLIRVYFPLILQMKEWRKCVTRDWYAFWSLISQREICPPYPKFMQLMKSWPISLLNLSFLCHVVVSCVFAMCRWWWHVLPYINGKVWHGISYSLEFRVRAKMNKTLGNRHFWFPGRDRMLTFRTLHCSSHWANEYQSRVNFPDQTPPSFVSLWTDFSPQKFSSYYIQNFSFLFLINRDSTKRHENVYCLSPSPSSWRETPLGALRLKGLSLNLVDTWEISMEWRVSQPVKLFSGKGFGGDGVKPKITWIAGVFWCFWRERNGRDRSLLPVRFLLRGWQHRTAAG